MNYTDPAQWKVGRYDPEPLDVLLADIAVRVQLTPTDYQKAVDRYVTISEWIDREASPLHGKVELVYPQGGFAIGATIAGYADTDFDIDLMAQLTFPSNVDPEVPLATLHEAIRGEKGSRYYGMTDRKTRCVTVTYAEMHLDLTPTVRTLSRPERTGLIFHSKPEKPLERTRLWANPYGFAEWFNERTRAEQPFGFFFEGRSLQYDQARLQVELGAEADPVPAQMPAYRKSLALVALQLLKRWRNITYGQRHPTLRCPPSVLLAHYVALHANQTASLADELAHQVEQIIAILETEERADRLVYAHNERCREDVLTDRWPADRSDQRTFLDELRRFRDQLAILRRGVSLQQAFEVLEGLFGEKPARGALEKTYEQHEVDRLQGRNRHVPGVGRIPALGAAATVPTAARSTPRNTFFGER